MKKIITATFIFTIYIQLCYAQMTLITPGNNGNIQVPNLTNSQIIAIQQPQKGMVAYDISFNCLRFYNGTEWICSFENKGVNPVMVDAWKYANTVGNDYGSDIVIDPNGNIYVLINTNVPAYQNGTMNLIKFDSNHNVLWTKTALNSFRRRLCLDNNGNIYVVGNFDNTAIFDGNSLTSNGSTDCFIAKYNATGQLQWVRSNGTMSAETSDGVWADNNGNVFVVGNWAGSTIFTNGSTYLMKYDSNGNLLYNWSSIASSYFGAVKAFQNSNGEIYLVGNFATSSVNIGGITIYGSNSGLPYMTYIAKMNSNGNAYWVRTSQHHLRDICLDNTSNMYIVGDFHTSATFNGVTYNATGITDLYIAKLDNDGNTIWYKNFGGTSVYEGRSAGSVAVDNLGSVYISGYYGGGNSTSTLIFGNYTLTNNSSNYNGFLGKLDSNGVPQWVRQYGAASTNNYGGRVAIAPNNNIYVIGSFSSSINFDNTTLVSTGNVDPFIAIYKPFK